MATVETLALIHDLLHHESEYFPPTSASVAHINETLGFGLPESLILFAQKSRTYGSWLAGLGEDFDSDSHIIRINKWAGKIRRRKLRGHGAWEFVKPRHFIAFTHGHDYDFECFDCSKWDASTGEYAIQYWAPPRIFGSTPYRNFTEYLEKTARDHLRSHRRKRREEILRLLAGIDAELTCWLAAGV